MKQKAKRSVPTSMFVNFAAFAMLFATIFVVHMVYGPAPKDKVVTIKEEVQVISVPEQTPQIVVQKSEELDPDFRRDDVQIAQEPEKLEPDFRRDDKQEIKIKKSSKTLFKRQALAKNISRPKAAPKNDFIRFEKIR